MISNFSSREVSLSFLIYHVISNMTRILVAPFNFLWLFEFWYHDSSLRLINHSRSVGKGALWKLPLSRLRPAVPITCAVLKYILTLIFSLKNEIVGIPGGSVIKNLPASAEDTTGSIPGLGRSTCQHSTKFMNHTCGACALDPGSCNDRSPFPRPVLCNKGSPWHNKHGRRNSRVAPAHCS